MSHIIGIYPQQQMVMVDDNTTDDQIRTRFGLGDAEFSRVPYVDTTEPDPVPGKMWIPGDEWSPLAVTRTWTMADAPILTPSVVTQRQMRLWLLSQPHSSDPAKTMLDEANAFINAPTDNIERRQQQIEWEKASIIERANPLVSGIGMLLGLDNDALDQAFREASAIT